MSVVDTCSKLGFQNDLVVGESVRSMTKIVEIFVPIFRIIAWLLSAAAMFLLITFATKMIRDKKKDIGILKAIGTKNRTVSLIFGVQILLIFLLTAALSTLGYALFVGETNKLLIHSLRSLPSAQIIPDLTFLRFRGDVALQSILWIFLLALLSFLLPILRIYFLDPIKILRRKE